MQDITHKLGTNQHAVKEKFTTKAGKVIKWTLIHLLILATAGSLIYAKTTHYVAEKEKSVLEQKLQTVEAERDTLKALSQGK